MPDTRRVESASDASMPMPGNESARSAIISVLLLETTREGDGEHGAATGRALHRHAAALGLGQLLHYRQAEPCSACRARWVGAIETLEDVRQVVRRDSLARVGNPQRQQPILWTRQSHSYVSPAGVWRRAFSSRLPTICSVRSASTKAGGNPSGAATSTSTPFSFARCWTALTA